MTKIKTLCAALLLTACGTLDDPTNGGDADVTPNAIDEDAVDLDGVMRQVHFAYRPDGPGFAAGHTTYGVEVSPDGSVAVTPVDHGPLADGDSPGDGPRAGATLTLRTSRIARGTPGAATAPRSIGVDDDGGLAIVRGDVVEHLRNGESGVEQSWEFAAPPAGAGDLELHVAVAGMELVAETETGLHFVDPETGLGFRYGLGTWIDADEDRFELTPRFEGDEIVLRVPAEILDDSSFPAVLDPIIYPELGIDTPVYRPGGGANAKIAYGGGNYLVVWADAIGSRSQVRGARVRKSDGVLLDPLGITIGEGYLPQVAHDGTRFFVVWADRRSGNLDIYGSRVSSSGGVVDPTGIAIASGAGDQGAPAVVWAGSAFQVAWEDRRTGSYDIWGARVSTSGGVSSPFALSIASGDQRTPNLASSGSATFCVWSDYRNGNWDVYGTRLGSTGSALDPSGRAIGTGSADQREPSIGYAGAYLVAWQEGTLVNTDIRARSMSTSGGFLTGVLNLSSAAYAQTRPEIGCGSSQCLVAWSDGRALGRTDVYGLRVTATSGAVSGASNGSLIRQSATSEWATQLGGVAFDGTYYLAVWAGGPGGVAGRRVTTSGGLVGAAETTISFHANMQTSPAVAFDGTNYLVVWQDQRSASADIVGARVTTSGSVLDPSGILLAWGNEDETTPRVAFDGTNYLVAWHERSSTVRRIRARRVARSGAALDGTPLPVAAVADQLTGLAYGGGRYLALWTSGDAHATRISTTGAVLDASGISLPGAESVASDGSTFLVVFGNGDIKGVRISGSGGVLDGTGFPIASGAAGQRSPSVAWNGSNYLVAWTENRTGSDDIYGARVTSSGVVRDIGGRALSTAGGAQGFPVVSTMGAAWLVTWEDQRNGNRDLYSTQVAPDGTPREPGGFAIASSTEDERHGGAACRVTSTGVQCLVTYDRVMLAPESTVRVRARFYDPRSSTTTRLR